METIRRVSNAVSRFLQRIEMLVGCICLALMLALMLTNAIARYLFDFPIVWSDELNNFFFVWLGFMACALMKRVTFSGLLRIPLKYVYSILPISFVLMIVHIVNNIINDTCGELAASRGEKEA